MGVGDLYAAFDDTFWRKVVSGTGPAFVEAKLAERDARHARMGDSRYVLEPHIKEGKGGLRDLQTLFWIAKYLYRVKDMGELVERGVFTAADVRHFNKAQDFLWTVRCHLHYVAGRPEERLTFNVQDIIAKRIGYSDRAGARGVERFMKHYFRVTKTVGDLTRILCAVLEEEHKKSRKLFRIPLWPLFRRMPEGFRLDTGRLTFAAGDVIVRDPVKILRLFHIAQHYGLDIHPHALRAIQQNLRLIDAKVRADPEANRVFMEMLTSENDPETTLKRMNDAGVFGQFIPDFGRVVAQMQYDMYHVYTVDEHTIHAIGVLRRIETGELKKEHAAASIAAGDIRSRRALYLAVLLHDIAKGRGGDHSELGAEIALRLAPRLGLDPWETETVSWLVRHHLVMSRTAFKRDVDNPKTVTDFVALVQSPERLRMLLLLTDADIHAVGPGIWNNWKAGLLERALLPGARGHGDAGRPAGRPAGGAGGAGQGEAARASSRLEREPARGVHRPRLRRLLARLRRRVPGPPLQADAQGRGRRQAALGRKLPAPFARRDRGHAVRPGPPRPVRPDRRRHGPDRRFHRRRQGHHAGQRHGARHLLDPGNLRPRLRQPRPAGPAEVADRGRDRRPHPHRAGAEGGARAGAAQPHPGVHRAARGVLRQQGQRHPHGHRGERPRPAGLPPRRHLDAHGAAACRSPAPTSRPTASGWSTCSTSRTCSG